MLQIAWNHSKNGDIAKDIVHEVFISLWERKNDTVIDDAGAFLATAVKFQVFKHYQKETRRAELAKVNYAFEDICLDEQKIDAAFLQDFIDGVVEQMPKQCRVIFQYSRNEGLNNKEIAEKINISEKGVENTLGRALKIIRMELRNYGLGLLAFLITFLR